MPSQPGAQAEPSGGVHLTLCWRSCLKRLICAVHYSLKGSLVHVGTVIPNPWHKIHRNGGSVSQTAQKMVY